MIKNLLANAGDVRDAGLDMTEATWHVHMKGIRFENFEKLQRNQSCLIFATPWTVASQAPLSMDSPDKNTGLGSHYLLQGDNIIKRLIQGIFLKTNKKTNYKKVINC